MQPTPTACPWYMTRWRVTWRTCPPPPSRVTTWAGKIKALGVTVGERLAASTDIPAVSESPEPKGLHVTSAIGRFAPAKTPVAIVERLNRELNEILATPEGRKTFEEQAATVGKGAGAEFAESLRKELVHNAAVVLATNIEGE